MSEQQPVESAPASAAGAALSHDLTLSDMARPRIRSRSALLVAVAVGLALFVLVASAFSVAAESRVVATKSNQLHSCDEILRSAITVRSQLGSAVNFAQLDRSQNTDSSRIINAALADARRSVSEMDATSYCVVESGDASLVKKFSDSALAVAGLLATGADQDLDTARTLLIGQMDTEYGELIEALIEQREILVDSLTKADETLGQLGTLATFIIAFFVPTVAMFVYRQITRRQRETIELARLLSEARAGIDWRSDLIHSAAELVEREAEHLPASSMALSLRSRLRDLDFLVGATAIGHGYTFEALTVGDLRDSVRDSWPTLVSVAGDGSDVLWGDRKAILLLLNDVVRNAVLRGAERVLVSGGIDSDGVWLSVTDNGRSLDEDAVNAILGSPNLVDATDEHLARRLEPDTSLLLIIGRMIAPALGGSFDCDSVGSNTRCTLRLPHAKTRRTAAPKLVATR
ncbi:MAG: ATP-binding protein [Acidimicrobiales bacterium]|nr:ATP-binding protein [Acidimicrobiales bacterium]